MWRWEKDKALGVALKVVFYQLQPPSIGHVFRLSSTLPGWGDVGGPYRRSTAISRGDVHPRAGDNTSLPQVVNVSERLIYQHRRPSS